MSRPTVRGFSPWITLTQVAAAETVVCLIVWAVNR